MKKISVVVVLLFSFLFFSSQADAAGSSQLLIINKQTNTLAYYNAGKLVKTFKVATGRSRDLTPEGKFKIVTKIVNRPYYKKGIPGGDPRNPLGNRWMGLDAQGTYGDTYAIHGNNDESSIGKYVSSGCIRMHNEEVRWLFDQIQLYTPVVITYSSSSFDAIAKANGYTVTTNGWAKINGDWYFYTNGTVKTGWQSINGTWYYFSASGVMKTGWLKDGANWYYLQPGGSMQKGWAKIGGTWYYFNKSGIMQQGWLKDGGGWYYFDGSGAMQTGWLKWGGSWFYLNSSGVTQTGWESVKGTWYYFNGSGVMKTGWLSDGGNKYYLNTSGAMSTGWEQISNKWYFFGESGKMAVNTFIDGYKLGEDGAWVIEYVALGDSLAAGMTPLGVDRPLENGKDPDPGYPNFIADSFKSEFNLFDFDNFGVSGYTTENVIADFNRVDVQKEIKEATHLTIDIGANDLLPVIHTNPAQAPEAIAKAAANLNTILGTIDQMNPNVKVYVMGYYNPFPYMPQEQQAQLLPLLIEFNKQIQAQAVLHGDAFVSTDTLIAGKYEEYLPNPQNIHLSLTGYQAVAGEFWKVMK